MSSLLAMHPHKRGRQTYASLISGNNNNNNINANNIGINNENNYGDSNSMSNNNNGHTPNNNLIRQQQLQRQQQLHQQQPQHQQYQQQQQQYTQQQFQQQQQPQQQNFQQQNYSASDGAVVGSLIANQMSLTNDPIYLNELLSGLPVLQSQPFIPDPQYLPFRQWQNASSEWSTPVSQTSPLNSCSIDLLGPSYGPTQQGPFPRFAHHESVTADVAKVVPPMICGYCPANAQKRCIDCSDVLCETCLNNHSMNPITKDHCVVAIRCISPIGTSSGSVASNSPPIAAASVIDVGNCVNHNEILRYVCEQCTTMVCQECTLWAHLGHSIVEIGEYSTLAVPKLRSAIEQARQGKQLVRNSIDRAVASTQSIERDAAEVAQRIRKSIRNYVTCLEEREKYLLEYLDSLRLTKVTALAEQMVGLRSTLSGLADQQITLQKTLENAHTLNGGDMCTLLTENDRRSVEYAQIYYHLLPKDEYMAFVAPSNELLQEIRSHGDIQLIERPVVTRSPQEQGTRRHRYISYQQPPTVKRPPAPFVDHESVFASIYPHLDPINETFPKDVIGQSIPGSKIYVTLKPTLKASKAFAIEGHADGQVSRPWGLCVDRNGRIIVADRRNHRIQIFDKNGVFQSKFGTQGFSNGQFELPAGITTDPENRIVVVDKDNHRVQVFSANGHFIFKFGSLGSESGQFQYPWGVAVNTRGDILISDTRNHRLQLFNKNGAFLARHNFDSYYYYRDLLGLVMPRGICFLPNGKIIVSDFDNHRLLLLNDNLAPRCLGVVGYDQNHWLEFSRPSGICCDDAGRVIVADSKSQRVMVFSPTLEFLYSVSHISNILYYIVSLRIKKI